VSATIVCGIFREVHEHVALEERKISATLMRGKTPFQIENEFVGSQVKRKSQPIEKYYFFRIFVVYVA
jgi:hypothetical protein